MQNRLLKNYINGDCNMISENQIKELSVIEQIKNKLAEIEQKENVTILFAVESGPSCCR